LAVYNNEFILGSACLGSENKTAVLFEELVTYLTLIGVIEIRVVVVVQCSSYP